jgi:hypothetical protein
MSLWTRERLAAEHARLQQRDELAARRARHDESIARAKLYRLQSGTVTSFPTRPPVTVPQDEAA